MSEAVHLLVYPMYFYGMTKKCIPDFLGGMGIFRSILELAYWRVGPRKPFIKGFFHQNGSTVL